MLTVCLSLPVQCLIKKNSAHLVWDTHANPQKLSPRDHVQKIFKTAI